MSVTELKKRETPCRVGYRWKTSSPETYFYLNPMTEIVIKSIRLITLQ